MKTISIKQKKIKGCNDSFFYDGFIAETDKAELLAVGEIRIYHTDKKGNVIGQHNGWKDFDDFPLDIETDKDLEKIGSNDDDEYYWDMNNWFEITDKETGDSLETDFGGYDEAIKTLK